MTFNNNHPELKEGEMFLTNTDFNGYKEIGWRSKRKGNVAYTINGVPLKYMFPVFVQKQEYDEGRKNDK